MAVCVTEIVFQQALSGRLSLEIGELLASVCCPAPILMGGGCDPEIVSCENARPVPNSGRYGTDTFDHAAARHGCA